ncbi:uncharacterized protein EI97DRAFT_426774 [Westerdykella ornata]|uniref:Nab2-like CCCH zinc finger domain-containing protein n=1 Tax=Westerdykella ornata TaxID=318751 RepID=A0A6A6J7U9_WESOR|nr:uncharacterized protein EI97DRAFT_426774 [Westerdykella ornata]KAF2272243.1 hypothetical protein EI97DRAFT_426774 [Westerdykella ornata]
MSVDFSIGSPFATTLQGIVQPKLAEYGWTTGDPEDSTIFEYILLMLGNNKDESQIASELSNDLLDLGPENPETQQFAKWLFDQIRQLTNGPADAPQPDASQMEATSTDAPTGGQDTEMDGTGEASQSSIPTGPKAMRNGSGAKMPRGGRMLNNINRQMGRDDSALHRVRGSQGSGGRIDSHARAPPKGPRSDNIGRGVAALANGRGTGNVGVSMGGPGMNMNGMNMGGMGMPGMPMAPMGQSGMPGMLTPQQQMALMQMYEQQAHMMQQIFAGQTPAPYINPNFPQNNRKQGRPLHERVDKSRQGNKQSLPPSTKFTKNDGQDETMTDSTPAGDGSAMEVEGGRPDPFQTMCKFNLRCGKPDCPFAHQSPTAPEGTPLDMNDTCSFGVKCTNKKCVGKHPSPAQRQQFQSEQECAFWPNCRDPVNCPYKHPEVPPCRNGADCTTPGCKFWHTSVMCKYNPCTNFRCPYKHVEGQKKTFKDKVWVAPKPGDEQKKEHVSERKFVEDDAEEELIIPGKNSDDDVVITT